MYNTIHDVGHMSSSLSNLLTVILCLDKPSKPEGPLAVKEIFKDHCHISWNPPKDDGGLPIEHYVVESMDMDTKKWVEVGKVQEDTQCGVPGLEPGKRYKFRVKAVNSEGESEALVTDTDILAKDPFGKHGTQCNYVQVMVSLMLLLVKMMMGMLNSGYCCLYV